MEERTLRPNSREDFKKIVNQLPYFIVKFTASWCGPCKRSQPLVNKLFNQLPKDFYYVEIDIDKPIKSVANSLRIKSVPTMMNYKNGMGEFMVVGSDEDKIKNFFSNVVKSYHS
tara:strand:+ start:168 stop:509 length:342 start_codon:yes stop_codon:yes gene_type:complete